MMSWEGSGRRELEAEKDPKNWILRDGRTTLSWLVLWNMHLNADENINIDKCSRPSLPGELNANRLLAGFRDSAAG